MAVPYSNTKLRVPKGFQNILEGLAREILRNQPQDVYEFGDKYFQQLMRNREESGYDPAVHGAKLEDRFYNNDSFKSPSVDSGDPQQQEAALKIQTEYRRHAAEKEVEDMKEDEAALKIQAGFRGYQDRQKVMEMKESSTGQKQEEEEVDIDLNDPEVEAAAVKIQAGFKGFKARQELHKKDETPTKQDEEEEEVDIDLNDPEVATAALKIQAGFRGHKTRQEIKSKQEQGTTQESSQQQTDQEEKKEEEEIDIDLTDPETEKAAVKIQAGFKGYKARKEMKGKEGDQAPAGSGDQQQESGDQQQESGDQQQESGDQKADQSEEVDIDLTDPEVEKAATKIQAGFKGFKVRQEIKDKKDQKGEQETAPETIQEETKQEETAQKEDEAKTEEPAQEETGKVPDEAFIKLPEDKAQKILETLSAFKSYKKPTKLPDRLRLTKKNLISVKRWTHMAKKKVKRGTFSSMQSLIGYWPELGKEIEEEANQTVTGQMEEEKTEQDLSTGDKEGEKGEEQVSLGDKEPSIPDIKLNQEVPTFNFNAFDDLYAESDSDWKDSSDEEDDDMGFGLFGGGDDFKTQTAPQMKQFADGMSGVMTNIATEMIPMTDKMITKEKMYEPYKAGRKALKNWIKDNYDQMTPDERQRRQKQLECYNVICHIYQNMDDAEDEEVNKEHKTRLKELMQEIHKCGQIPIQVQTVQDAAAQQNFNPEDMDEILTPMIGNMGNALQQMMGGFGALFGGGGGGGNVNLFDDDSDDEMGGGGSDCTIL